MRATEYLRHLSEVRNPLRRYTGRKGLGLCLVILLFILVGIPVWQTYQQVRRERLSRALLIAIKKSDIQMVASLLAEGADANARVQFPAPRSFWQRLADVLGGQTYPRASSGTYGITAGARGIHLSTTVP